MNFPTLIHQVVSGLCFGALLFLLAAGLSLMYGLMGVVNIAHGGYFMVGGYVGLSVFQGTGSFVLAILAGLATGGALGLLTERFFLRPLYALRGHEPVLMTFALCIILGDFSLFVWKGMPTWIPTPSLLAFSVSIAGSPYPVYRLFSLLIGLLVFAGVWWFQEKTRWGAIVRAGVDDKEMVTGLGINIPLVFTMVFALGAFLAGFGGVVGSPLIGLYPGMEIEVFILALAVVIVGGIGSLPGCLLTCFLIGLADTFGKTQWPGYASLTIWLALVIILLVKPTGLFGRKD